MRRPLFRSLEASKLRSAVPVVAFAALVMLTASMGAAVAEDRPPPPNCDHLQPSDYHSQGEISGSVFTVDQNWSIDLHWNFFVGPAYHRDVMANVVTIVRGSTAAQFLNQTDQRRLQVARSVHSGDKGFENHGSTSNVRAGGVYTVSVVYYGRNGGPLGALFGVGGVWGLAWVTCTA
jgi:hypothetical protein